jgi:hypothetical protein
MSTISRPKRNIKRSVFISAIFAILFFSTLIPVMTVNSIQQASPATILSEIVEYTSHHDAYSSQPQSEDASSFFYTGEGLKLIKISSTGISYPVQNNIESNNAANAFSSFIDASFEALHKDLISTFLLLDIPPPASIII